MGLCRQFAQRHFGTLHRLALGAESGIAQTGATVFPEITAFATPASVAKAAFGALATANWATVAAWACRALAWATLSAAIAPRHHGFGFLLPGTVIPTHRHHGLGHFGSGHKGGRFGYGGLGLLWVDAGVGAGTCICF
jgi:hypothetical protein